MGEKLKTTSFSLLLSLLFLSLGYLFISSFNKKINGQ